MCSALLCVSRQNCSPARYRGPSPGKSHFLFHHVHQVVLFQLIPVCFVLKEMTF